MKTEIIDTDILCVGGGIAVSMAAIRAGELGAKVVIAEKGKTEYSGAARAGNDLFWCYIPDVHGPDVESFIKESMKKQLGLFLSNLGHDMLRTLIEKSYDIVNLWNERGIPNWVSVLV